MKRKITEIILFFMKVFKVWFVFSIFNSVRAYLYDMSRYIRHSSSFKTQFNSKQLEARIFANLHVIEKGLSLKNVKIGFGKEVILSLINLLHEYDKRKFDKNKIVYKSAVSCIREYLSFHKNKKYNFEEYFIKSIVQFEGIENNKFGGTKESEKWRLLLSYGSGFKNLVQNRHSIRDFSRELVPVEKIIEAVEIAQRSPSVCNRQGSKVYIVQNIEVKNKILHLQNGNRGFGENANIILIITSDLSIFHGINERNQAYIDAGMFSMTLLLSLTSLGIATCTLNWCVDKKTDKGLRRIININKSENIVLMLLVGQFPNKFKVALSSRREIEEVITLI